MSNINDSKSNYMMLKMERMAGNNKNKFLGKKKDTRQFIVINEERLIAQVQSRPILYDKALKGYRKPTVREQAWQEVAKTVACSVEESKKRWRSLRDAFMKQYKLIHSDDPLVKKKKWLFYDQMEFLGPYLEMNYGIIKHELERDDSNNRNDEDYLYKTEYCKPEYCIMETTEEDSLEEILLENEHEVIEHIDDGCDSIEVECNDEEIIDDNYDDNNTINSDMYPTKTNDIDSSNPNEISETEENNDLLHEETEHQQLFSNESNETEEFLETPITCPTSTVSIPITTTVTSIQLCESGQTMDHSIQANLSSSSTIENNDGKDNDQHTSLSLTSDQISIINQIDPNEKFLLSCAPILRRLSDKKNCLARLRIQQILYDIEFGDSI